jgi:hypothetical protein
MRCTGSWLPPRPGMSGSGRLPSGASNCRAGQAGGARGHRCDRAGSLPRAQQQRAAQIGADVAGGQVHIAAASAGQHALDLAVASFLRGFELALLLAGAILAAAAVVGFLGLRHLQSPASQQRQRTDVRTSR